ncbi:PPOX class F420-dependent oxidoreductase [Streptomyces sp. SAS_270]|uniref:PPOX class F420-dependent oxidoreductase n=1 Tax=Streptomyces sp. SAS_270 TaxID=3412748 RepID=UPI00403C9E56
MNGKVEGHIRARLPAPNFWHLATVGPDGAPQVSPMWADIEGEYVMVNTSIGRVKEENLRRNPNVSLSHHDPENPYDRAEIRGRVVRFLEGEEAKRSMDRLAQKQVGAACGDCVYGGRIANRIRPRYGLPPSMQAWITAHHCQPRPVVRAGSCSSLWRSSVRRSPRSARSTRH